MTLTLHAGGGGSADQKTFDDVLGSRGVRRATYANRAVQVPNDLDEIIKAIEVYS